MHNISSKLDWTRMLGFEQIADSRSVANGGKAKIDAKMGDKVGLKLGSKAGVKV